MRVMLLCLLAFPVHGLENGLARTPQMGYNSWYDVECSRWNETTMRRVADAMVAKGLVKLGYKYLNLDDCWAKGRNADGTLFADKSMFQSGTLKELADYVHRKGMLFGTYTDRGARTCAGRPGAEDHEALDAKTYAEWGVDYLKEDSCHASKNHSVAFEQYGKMRDGLNATGRPILFSLCGWSEWYAPVGRTLGNSWRIGPDDNNWGGVLTNIDIMAGLEKYAGPGGWNDPCLLLSRTWHGSSRVTELQTRAQFSMWAVLAAPLLISGTVLNMTDETLATYSNVEVIRVSQDALGKQGRRIFGDPLRKGAANVWARPLEDGSYALVFINSGHLATDVTCDSTCFAAIAIKPSTQLSIRDLWSSKLWSTSRAFFTAPKLAPAGGHLMVRVKPLSEGYIV